MAKKTARTPRFSQITFTTIKHWFKQKLARRNRKAVRQARDVEEFVDKRLDHRSLD